MAAPFLFTPVESGLGGLTLGLLSYAKFSITGRILGISGAVRGLVCGSQEAWRVAFVAGLLAGGFALQGLLPSAFEAFPAGYTLGRALLAGVLVGLGTARGSGCTSGHGISGNASLSLRSFVATCAFMLSGMLAAHLSGAAAVFGLPPGIAPLAPLSPLSPTGMFGVTLLVLAVATWLLLSAAARQLDRRAGSPAALREELVEATALEKAAVVGVPPPAERDAQKLAALSTAADLFSGFLFALGLGVSGMAKPSKVAGFLSVLSRTFDPSLLFVMGGALLVALPAFQLALRRSSGPLCAACYDLPAKKGLDANLISGALLFGAGWGVGGICPGPGLVALATLQPQALAFVAAMAVGMQLDRVANAAAAKLVGVPAKA
ncbi:hypothetical protein ABPG75_007700 [Micractinium tetrahymenae]